MQITQEILTYTRIFGEFNRILGEPPTVLHRIVCPDRMNDMDPTGQYLKNMKYINEVFENLQKNHKNISIFDPRTAPQYIPDVRLQHSRQMHQF